MSQENVPLGLPAGDAGVIEILDPHLQPQYRFIKLPRAVAYAPDLSNDAKMTYAVLLDYGWRDGKIFPGQERLGRDLGGIHPKTVRRYLQELKSYGLIDWIRQGFKKPNIYRILPLASCPHLDLSHELIKGATDDGTDRPDHRVLHVESRRATGDGTTSSHQAKRQKAHSATGDGTALSRPDGTGATGPERTGLSPYLDIHEVEVDEEVSTNRRAYPPADSKEERARQTLADVFNDLQRELGDRAPLAKTVTRACNLHQRSGLELDEFVDRIYQARRITRERQASIHAEQPDSAWGNRKTMMPYFFGVLEDRLGLKPADSRKG